MTTRFGFVGLVVAVLWLVGCADKTAGGADPKSPTVHVAGAEGSDELEGDDDLPPRQDFAHSCGISVSSSPQGAVVVVDGKKVGKTPTTVDGLGTGAHDVTFVYESGERATLSVELAEGEYKNVHHSYTPNSSDAHILDNKKK